MNAWARSSWPRRSSPTTMNASPSSRTRSSSARRSGQSGRRSRPRRVDVERAEQLAQHGRRGARAATARRRTGARASSRAARPSAAAGRGSASSVLAAWPRFGATNSSRAGRVRVERRELVLAEHAARRGSRRRRPPRAPSSAPAAPPSGPEPRAEPVGHRIEHAAERAQVGVDPLVAVDGLGGRQRRERLEAGVGGDEPLALGGRLGQLLERRAGHRRAAGRRCRGPPAGPGSSRSRHPRMARPAQFGQSGLGARGHHGRVRQQVERRGRAGPRTP